jgi:hypothetical protein
MRMTDTSKNSDGNNGSNGNKRPASTTGGASTGHSLPKIVKFNGYASKNPENSNANRNAKTVYSREELLEQRKALPIYSTAQRYSFQFITLINISISFKL